MEGLSINDNRTRPRSPHATGNPSRSPRLPTPETSRSSYDAVEETDSPRSHRRAAPLHALLSQQSPDGRTMDPGDGSRFRNPRIQSAPHSPPYAVADSQKPSLPPLKTLLGDSITSPPQTPTMLTASFQPAPREPAYTTSTYKPPSLYPNKKQRTGSLAEPAAPYATVSTFSSPGLPPASLEPKIPGMPQRSESDSHAALLQSRRLSVQPANEYVNMTTRMNVNHHYRTPEHTPTSMGFERSFALSQSMAPGCRDKVPPEYSHFGRHSSYRDTRRASETYLGYNNNGVYEPRQGGYASHPSRVCADMPTDEPFRRTQDGRSLGLPHRHPTHSGTPFGQGPFDAAQLPYFMPSGYEYQHGKARKRSNLPKQSTEIMKTWFDQNINNPYPSEEQKILFSNATGISMTQVSNWFINHRRRCPELRDKREKSRHNGREGDM